MKLRHATRILILLFLAGLIYLNDYYTLKGQLGGQATIELSGLYSWLDKLHGSSPHRTAYAVFAQGNLWSFSVKEFRLSDPLAVISELLVIKQAYPAFLLSAVIPVLLTLVLGRVFCGWICPLGLLSEIVTGCRRALARISINVFSFRTTPLLKYVVLGVGLAFSLIFSVRYFFWIYPPRLISDLLRDALVGEVTSYALVFLGAVLLLELLFVERFWCRCLCPGGALYALLGRWRHLRIQRQALACTGCEDCDSACPYGLQPSRKNLGGECDNCGLCRAACEIKALRYHFSSLQETRQ